jgi:DNA-binding MarR family transcriptional regulator
VEREDSSARLADLLQRLTKRLRYAQAQRLAPLGLTPAQGRALRVITRSEKPLRMTELADRLGIVPRSVTTVIDALEEAGLVRREIDPTNRRAIRLHLTAGGRAARDDMREARRRASEELFSALSAADRRRLSELLTILDRAGVAASPRQSPGPSSSAAPRSSTRQTSESTTSAFTPTSGA